MQTKFDKIRQKASPPPGGTKAFPYSAGAVPLTFFGALEASVSSGLWPALFSGTSPLGAGLISEPPPLGAGVLSEPPPLDAGVLSEPPPLGTGSSPVFPPLTAGPSSGFPVPAGPALAEALGLGGTVLWEGSGTVSAGLGTVSSGPATMPLGAGEGSTGSGLLPPKIKRTPMVTASTTANIASAIKRISEGRIVLDA